MPWKCINTHTLKFVAFSVPLKIWVHFPFKLVVIKSALVDFLDLIAESLCASLLVCFGGDWSLQRGRDLLSPRWSHRFRRLNIDLY